MIVRRKPKELYLDHRDRLLDAMGRCRHVVTRTASEVEYGCPTYRALETLLKAIDGVAGVVAGDAELYWEQGSNSLPKWTDKGTR